MYRNRDLKNFRAPEGVHLTRLTTYLIIFGLLDVLSWMFERDSHQFNKAVIAEISKVAECRVKS